jgi:uncharacterized phage protein (TIGR02218 family)
MRRVDLEAGRWDRAALDIFLVDWEDVSAQPIPIASGEFGDVCLKRHAFEAELRGPTALLEAPVVEQTSPECRAELGDRRCRVDMAARVRVTSILAVDGETGLTVASAAMGDAYANGSLRWITGANGGLRSTILASNGASLTLREPPHFRAAAGDLVEIAEGCDKSFATCSGRFGNALNFRGEPHLPGTDLLTRYVGG